MAWQQTLAKHQNLVENLKIKIHSESRSGTGTTLMAVVADGEV